LKFEDWWRGIRLFFKSNRVIETDDRITAILACLRGGVAGIYAQQKLDELDEGNPGLGRFCKGTQNDVQRQDKSSRC